MCFKDLCCVSNLSIHMCTIDSGSSLRSATLHKGSLRWGLSSRYFPIYKCAIRVREVRSCSHRAMDICAVFQLFLFTTALLIRARVCAQRPHIMSVCAGDCHGGLHLLYECLRCVCFSFEFVATPNSGNLRWRVSLRTRGCQRVLLRSR